LDGTKQPPFARSNTHQSHDAYHLSLYLFPLFCHPSREGVAG